MIKRIAFLSAVLLTAACGGVPSTSAIYEGETTAPDTQQVIRVIARPPVDGMSPDAVVRGFLDACADSAEDYAIAREYLTGNVRASWNPNTGTQIYDSNNLAMSTNGDYISASAPLDSSITTTGKLAYNATDSSVSQQFRIAKNDSGQWRIAELPNGLMISRSDFNRSYRAYPIYFLGTTPGVLVSDYVMLPAGANGNATTLMRALLDGPASELQPTVTSAIPLGTKLTYSGVPVNNGIAQVDLSEEVLGADQTVRENMSAQIVWTLSSLPGVSGVRLTISGQQFEVPGISGIQLPSDWKEYSPEVTGNKTKLYSVSGANIYVVDEQGTSSIIARANLGVGQTLNSAQISPDHTQFAAVGQQGRELLLSAANEIVMNPIHTGASLSRPAWTAKNQLVTADYGTGLFAFTAKGSPLDIQLEATPFGTASDIKEISIAPDGVRAAIVFSAGDTDKLTLATFSWTSVGISIVGTRKIENSISNVVDVVWSSPHSLEILGSVDNGATSLLGLAVGTGQVTQTNAPVGAQSIAIGAKATIFAGVNDGDKSAVVKQVFGPWVKVSDGSAPFTVIE